jgi:phosphoserine phosphatase
MSYQLAIFDVDSTLIEQEVIDLLASNTQHGKKVAEITEAAMRGELDFDEALNQRVGLLQGLSVDVFDKVLQQISFSKGAIELIEGASFGRVFSATSDSVAEHYCHWRWVQRYRDD